MDTLDKDECEQNFSCMMAESSDHDEPAIEDDLRDIDNRENFQNNDDKRFDKEGHTTESNFQTMDAFKEYECEHNYSCMMAESSDDDESVTEDDLCDIGNKENFPNDSEIHAADQTMGSDVVNSSDVDDRKTLTEECIFINEDIVELSLDNSVKKCVMEMPDHIVDLPKSQSFEETQHQIEVAFVASSECREEVMNVTVSGTEVQENKAPPQAVSISDDDEDNENVVCDTHRRPVTEDNDIITTDTAPDTEVEANTEDERSLTALNDDEKREDGNGDVYDNIEKLDADDNKVADRLADPKSDTNVLITSPDVKNLEDETTPTNDVKRTEYMLPTGFYSWNPDHHGPNIVILPGRRCTARRQVVRRSADGVRGCHGFMSGRHAFVLVFNDLPWGSHCGIGVCGETTALHAKGYRNLLGQDSSSWGWDIPSGNLMHDGVITGQLSKEYEETRRLVLILDMDDGTLSIGIADKQPVVVHTGLSICKKPLFPAASLVYGSAEVTISLEATSLPESHCKHCFDRNGNDEPANTQIHNKDDNVDEMHNEEQYADDTNIDLAETIKESSDETLRYIEPAYTYTEVSDLPTDDQYFTQLGHGWDSVKRGGLIAVYPSVPYICFPSINFTGSVQGIRSRQGFTYGQHDWFIQEIKHFTPNVLLEDVATTQNDVIIGLVSDQHRTFNYGYSLDNLGDYAWAWRPVTNQKWHKRTVDRKSHDESCSQQPMVSLSRGIRVHLDVERQTLLLSQGDVELARFTGVAGDGALYPCIWFHVIGLFPVQIEYVRGPSEHIQNVILSIHQLESYEKDSFWNRRSLSRQPSSVCTPLFDNNVACRSFNWGRHSPGTKKQSNEIHVSTSTSGPAWAITADSVSGGRHCIDFVCSQPECLTLALVAAECEVDDTDEYGFGSTLQSWSWDIGSLKLHHAGNCLGRFPFSAHDFDATLYHRYRVIVDFERSGQNTASLIALGADDSLDLGIAFLNLPQCMRLGVAVNNAIGDVSVKMIYRSGPESYVGTSHQSTSCTLL